MKRKPGFYWVRFRSFPAVGPMPPEIAAWGSEGWRVSGSEERPTEDELDVLSERLMPPEPGFKMPPHLSCVLGRDAKGLLWSLRITGVNMLTGEIDVDLTCPEIKPPEATTEPDPRHPRTAR